MSSQNPYDYYSDETNHGSYQYIKLEDLVNNFMQQYTGDNRILGYQKRHQVLYWMKKGIQQFTFDALKEVKAIELELGDALDIIMPPDYVNYVRISWLDTETGEFHPMGENRKLTLATAYLQDNDAQILFDNNGYVLEGDSATEIINNELSENINAGIDCQYTLRTRCGEQRWGLDTSRNYNGTFNIDKRSGRIHFSSDVASRIIVLEYISDGLEYESESNVMIHKFAEMAINNWTLWNLLSSREGTQDYLVRRAKKDYDTSYRNSKIRLMNLKVAEISQLLKERNKWFK